MYLSTRVFSISPSTSSSSIEIDAFNDAGAPEPSFNVQAAAGDLRPSLCDRLSGLATAARSSAQLGLAIGAAVTAGLSVKAGYMGAMMAAPSAAAAAVSTGIVLGGTVAVQSGVGVLIEGGQGLRRDPSALSPAFVKSIKALGVAAYLCAMLGSAYGALHDEETGPLGLYMLANAAGQVVSGVVAEVVANRLVPHAVIPRELVGQEGAVIEQGSAQSASLRPAAEAALAVGQVITHAALMWTLLDQIPGVQQALGVPAGFRPGRDSAQDHVLAGLGVAAVIGASEAGRITAGEMSRALALTVKGATIRAAKQQAPQAPAIASVSPGANGALDDESLSRWQQCCHSVDRAATRIGLGADARGRLAGYVPILHLSVDALVTGPGSDFIAGLAAKLKKPLLDVALGVSHFTLSLLNPVDLLLRARPAVPGPVAAIQAIDGNALDPRDFLTVPSRLATPSVGAGRLEDGFMHA